MNRQDGGDRRTGAGQGNDQAAREFVEVDAGNEDSVGRDVFHEGDHDPIAGEQRLGLGVEPGGGAQGETGESEGAEPTNVEETGGDHDVGALFSLIM